MIEKAEVSFIATTVAAGCFLDGRVVAAAAGVSLGERISGHEFTLPGQYVGDDGEGMNGVESFWADLKMSGKAIFCKWSPKHLSCYVNELAARKNDRDEDTIEHMAILARSMIGRKLGYRDLIAPNGLPNRPAARSGRGGRPRGRSLNQSAGGVLTTWIPFR